MIYLKNSLVHFGFQDSRKLSKPRDESGCWEHCFKVGMFYPVLDREPRKLIDKQVRYTYVI